MGKGSKRRPTNEEVYRANYDRAFGKKKKIRHCWGCDKIIDWDFLFCEKCQKKNDK